MVSVQMMLKMTTLMMYSLRNWDVNLRPSLPQSNPGRPHSQELHQGHQHLHHPPHWHHIHCHQHHYHSGDHITFRDIFRDIIIIFLAIIVVDNHNTFFICCMIGVPGHFCGNPLPHPLRWQYRASGHFDDNCDVDDNALR